MIILGAKGLAKEILQLLHVNNNIQDLYFFDNVNSDTPDYLFDQFKVIKSWEDLEKHFNTKPEFIIGVGGSKTREFMADKAIGLGGKLTTLISDNAEIGHYGITIKKGVTVLSQAIITCDAIVGEGTLINKAAIISHDAKVGKYCEISPGAKILGRVTIGDFVEIGTNAVILPDVVVGSNCKIGAGAVVTKNVSDNTTVVGIPAKPLIIKV